MYGYPVTKAGGLRHVYLYYFGGYWKMSLAEAEQKIHLVKPYDNPELPSVSAHDDRRGAAARTGSTSLLRAECRRPESREPD